MILLPNLVSPLVLIAPVFFDLLLSIKKIGTSQLDLLSRRYMMSEAGWIKINRMIRKSLGRIVNKKNTSVIRSISDSNFALLAILEDRYIPMGRVQKYDH